MSFRRGFFEFKYGLYRRQAFRQFAALQERQYWPVDRQQAEQRSARRYSVSAFRGGKLAQSGEREVRVAALARCGVSGPAVA